MDLDRFFNFLVPKNSCDDSCSTAFYRFFGGSVAVISCVTKNMKLQFWLAFSVISRCNKQSQGVLFLQSSYYSICKGLKKKSSWVCNLKVTVVENISICCYYFLMRFNKSLTHQTERYYQAIMKEVVYLERMTFK